MKKHLLLIIVSAVLSLAPGCTADKQLTEKEQYAERVKDVFRTAWKSYKDYAWGLHAVNPISEKGHNWYSEPLLMTPVDAYSTMCVMGLDQEKEEAKELIFSSLDLIGRVFNPVSGRSHPRPAPWRGAQSVLRGRRNPTSRKADATCIVPTINALHRRIAPCGSCKIIGRD